MTTEKRLIDANEVWHKIHKRREAAYKELDHPRCNAYLNAEFDVMDAPTVDAVEVVHGQWFSLTDCSNAGVYCSVCHKKVWKEDYAWCNRKNKLRSNYCPSCGAKMDGERKDNG